MQTYKCNNKQAGETEAWILQPADFCAQKPLKWPSQFYVALSEKSPSIQKFLRVALPLSVLFLAMLGFWL